MMRTTALGATVKIQRIEQGCRATLISNLATLNNCSRMASEKYTLKHGVSVELDTQQAKDSIDQNSKMGNLDLTVQIDLLQTLLNDAHTAHAWIRRKGRRKKNTQGLTRTQAGDVPDGLQASMSLGSS